MDERLQDPTVSMAPFWGLLLGLALAGAGCTSAAGRAADQADGQGGGDNMTTAPELSIEVHRERVGVIYEYAELLARLERLPGTVAVRLDERDVERFRVGPAPSWLLALHLSEAASARWREGSGGFTETAPFFFSLRGDRLYAGVRYTTIGAAAINTPVLHEVQKDGRVVLFIGAQQGAAYMGSAREDFARRIDRPEIREVFRRRGVLEELPRPPSPMDPEYREK